MTYFTTGVQLQAALNALPTTKTGNFVAFDSFFYGQQYMSAYAGTLTPIEHFVQIGADRGFKPNATFDPTYYASAFADLKGKGFNSADLLYHFMQYGLDEGRAPNAALATFSGTAYLTANPDVAAFVNANLAQFGGSATNGALAHYVKFGAAEGRAAPGTSVSNGQTFTLTTGIDNFTGTAGNDIFVGGNGAVNTFGPADQLAGGAGTDTLKLFGGNVAAGIPSISGIENVYINGTTGDLNVSGQADVVSLEVENTAAATYTLAAKQALTVTNQTAAAAVTVAGTAAGGITLNNVIDKSVTPNIAQVLNVNTRDTSLSLKATGGASNIALASASATAAADMAALTKLTITGDAKLTVAANAGYTNLTTVDASANTVGVDFRQGVDTNLTFTGGTGADRVLVAGAVAALDKLDGGAGVDTLAIAVGGLLAPAVVNVKNFEILEVRGTTGTPLTQDASVFAPQNTLTGLAVVNTAGAQVFTVTNLAATAKDGIVVTAGIAANTTTLTTTVKDFVSGGTSDSATVTVNANAASTTAAGSSVLSLTFDNVDVLNLVSKGTVATNANTINLAATDAEKIVLSGNIETTLVANVGAVVSTGITEVDASGLVVANATAAGLTFVQGAGSTQSLLVTGSNGVDTLTVIAAKGTVVANGGNDVVVFSGTAAALADQSLVLSAKDFVASGAVAVTFAAGSANNAVINFSSDIEGKLLIGGVNLGTTTANQTVGTVINGQNNVALVGGVLQFDVNGDGAFNAANDFAITLTGLNTTVTYNAAGDFFVLA